MKSLSDIPNRAGFRFIGVGKFGNRFNCIVLLRPDGLHAAARESDGLECFKELAGWESL